MFTYLQDSFTDTALYPTEHFRLLVGLHRELHRSSHANEKRWEN